MNLSPRPLLLSAIRPLRTSSAISPATSTRLASRTRRPLPTTTSRSFHPGQTMTTEATVRTFFSSPNFAVVGASSNPAKYGHKVFVWYTTHSLPVTPINPTTPTITLSGTSHATLPSLSALPDPKQTSVSIITPPSATLSVLREAADLGVPAVWMQPGSFDDEVLRFARGDEARFRAVVAGDGGRGDEGWCVLVDGERGLRAAGKL